MGRINVTVSIFAGAQAPNSMSAPGWACGTEYGTVPSMRWQVAVCFGRPGLKVHPPSPLPCASPGVRFSLLVVARKQTTS